MCHDLAQCIIIFAPIKQNPQKYIANMKIHAYIERNSKGYYSIFTKESLPNVFLAGYGYSPQEAIKDFWKSYEDIKGMQENVPAIEVVFLYYLCGKKDRKRKPLKKGLRLIRIE